MSRPAKIRPARLRLVLPSTILLSALLSACATQGTTKTGFLERYDAMKPTKDHSADLIFVERTYVASQYQHIVIDPVEWRPALDTPPRDPAVVEQLKADFTKSLTERLSKDYQIIETSAPGAVLPPGTMRVRSAITNTRKANWWINAPVVVAGVSLSFVGAPGLPPPNPGGASEELEALDAQTGRRLVALATYNNGMPWQPMGYVQEFGHARQSFAKASALLHELVTRPVVQQGS